MIQQLSSRFRKPAAAVLFAIMYSQTVLAGLPIWYTKGEISNYKKTLSKHYSILENEADFNLPANFKAPLEIENAITKISEHKEVKFGGPGQPEMQAFTSVNASNMVDLFSGDFSYNIPLLDVGGYPVNIAYRGGITMDQEASWVGLGWNINPGTITRNMRGLPDDFNGKNDSITKTTSTKENKTIGVTVGGDIEILGLPKGDKPKARDTSRAARIGASLGIFHNNYKGWGLETGLNASLNSGAKGAGPFTAGLSFTNNSQDGLVTTPSISYKLHQNATDEKSGFGEVFSLSAPYSTRHGMKALQLSTGLSQYRIDNNNQRYNINSDLSSSISFANPSFTPTISIPYTSNQFSFTAKVGGEIKGAHGNVFLSGYVSTQYIADQDRSSRLPAYGYLNFQEANNNPTTLLDFNREKDMPYREKPGMPHIAVPSYTYDVFSITGEGTGGMFRPYRGDIGFVYDHYMRTRDASDRASIDLGFGDVFHGGVDLNINRSFTQSGPWLGENILGKTVVFRTPSALFESVYFRNPGEKSINSKAFYEAIGGDDVVVPSLYQANVSSSGIIATSNLDRYKNKILVGRLPINSISAVKPQRDKRAQVITYLSASDAETIGISKYIESYEVNKFKMAACPTPYPKLKGQGTGLLQQVYNNAFLNGNPFHTQIDTFRNVRELPGIFKSYRWTGSIEAPVTGRYTFTMKCDDRLSMWLNNTLIMSGDFNNYPVGYANLIAGEKYTIRIEYIAEDGYNYYEPLLWSYPGQTLINIPYKYFYPPNVEPLSVTDGIVTKEKRVNSFRKANHISEIDVLNPDGRRYLYGIPVYNLRQKETTFALEKEDGNSQSGLASYRHGVDNTTKNEKGRDNYFSSEEVPAYAHSFLLTGIVSPDYVDLTGDGITDDDLGDAVKFNYSRTASINNPYEWRAPYVTGKATYNEGLKTDSRDDKGSYVYGTKEMWYLNSIQSKNMVATFFLADRKDVLEIDEAGNKIQSSKTKLLRKICLYNKADFLQKDTLATPVKTVYFEYAYQLCRGINAPLNDSGKLTLKKIWFSYNGNNKGQLNPYVFTYHANNPNYATKFYDRWGNYKDNGDNPVQLSNADYPYALQDSLKMANNVAAWTLTEIKLPSGGRIKVDYESDDYAYVQNKRAMQMFNIAGFGSSPFLPGGSNNALYSNNGSFIDYRYIFIDIPQPVTSTQDVLKKYLDGLDKLHFRLNINVPGDKWGSGNETVPCYADIENYGMVNSTRIWVKIKGINSDATLGGSISPLVKAALQFLKLNLGSKAYPGSEVGSNISLTDAVKVLFSQVDNIRNSISGFDRVARSRSWMKYANLDKSFVRLTCPTYKKFGGGARVKRVTVYDNWNAMTGQKESKYGQEYTYTTTQEVDGKKITISSGVAAYEPGIGGEENPFHLPIEYIERVAALAPTTLGYTEEPLGESFYPSASVGYSKVRVRTINATKTRSANGYEETNFFTAKDFPTFVDRSMIDANTKKRFRPGLANFLRINAKHYVTIAQGFKVELNDMHGKVKSQATYPETDAENPTTYTENFYRIEDYSADIKRLSNKVMAMSPDGTIDTAALIGKDAELMLDMREQRTVVNGYNVPLNTDFFTFPFPPVLLIPTLLNLAQREETQFRSAGATKIIQRYGILDSVLHIDKGSRVTTSNMLYDSETGDVLLSRTKNEFKDPIYNFNYPAHWAYEGMGMAYKNIGLSLSGMFIKDGKITRQSGKLANEVALSVNEQDLFASGDEIFILSKPKTGTGSDNCNDAYATFPVQQRIWAIDANAISGGTPNIYFIDKDGKAFTGNDISMVVTRSGRKNMGGSVGAVSMLENPLVYNSSTQQYSIQLNTASKVINASVAKYKQLWKVGDKRKSGMVVNCFDPADNSCQSSDGSCTCNCLKAFFAYLMATHKLFTTQASNTTVNQLITAANSAGYSVGSCRILDVNKNKLFYALTIDSTATSYRAQLGGCIINISSFNGNSVALYQLTPFACEVGPNVYYKSEGDTGTVRQKIIYADYSMIDFDNGTSTRDTTLQSIITERAFNLYGGYYGRNAFSVFRFSNLSEIPYKASTTQATLRLRANLSGHLGIIDTAHEYKKMYCGFSLSKLPLVNWDYSTPSSSFNTSSIDYSASITAPFQNFDIDVTGFVNAYANRTTSSNSFVLRDNYGGGHPANLYATFYSERYSDTSKRPAILINYKTYDTLAVLQIESCASACDTLYAGVCYSAITDTVVNAYTYGILGNFRADTTYTYYGQRAETDPSTATNIRKFGTFNEFVPFWTFNNGKLQAMPDTTKWVWNSTMTLFNRRGFELENKDPLGRYNAGLYGYNQTLPTAVIQNSQYREAAFEGFEDYTYTSNSCDLACSVGRHFDFGGYSSYIDSTYSHTGKYSIKVLKDSSIGIAAKFGQAGFTDPSLVFSTNTSCSATRLQSIKTDSMALLPVFSPIAGKKVLISGWVKEDKDCKCETYTGNQIAVSIINPAGTTSIALIPSGNIIEGWQRYEAFVDVPSNATSISINLTATTASAAYFDDLRIHPFNANMKSFVYHPINLRLMAELDENNYATFYEYDDDGTLIRVKKETERGIKTIKETRSALRKEQ